MRRYEPQLRMNFSFFVTFLAVLYTSDPRSKPQSEWCDHLLRVRRNRIHYTAVQFSQRLLILTNYILTSQYIVCCIGGRKLPSSIGVYVPVRVTRGQKAQGLTDIVSCRPTNRSEVVLPEDYIYMYVIAMDVLLLIPRPN